MPEAIAGKASHIKGVPSMTKSDLGRTLAAIACTIVMSATCLVGAVGPAAAGSASSTTALRSIA